MEDISPSLRVILEVRTAIEGGHSVRQGLLLFLKSSNSDFSHILSAWMLRRDHNQETNSIISNLVPARRAVLQCFDRGLSGTPILSQLIELEGEIINLCESELDEQIKIMPIKMLLPLLGLMFPAYLLLLFGPFLDVLTKLGQ